MMKIKTTDGLVFEAPTAAELVTQLHAASRSPGASDAEWMQEAAGRAYTQTGRWVRTGTAEEFIQDLATAGLIEVTQNNS